MTTHSFKLLDPSFSLNKMILSDVAVLQLVSDNSSNMSNISSSANATRTNLMTSYQYAAFGINGPFVIVFLVLSIVIASIMMKLCHDHRGRRDSTNKRNHRRDARKNQRILFSLLLTLSLCSLFNMITRIGAEMAYISTQPKTVLIVFSILKGFDRSVICLTTLFEFMLITFVSHLFLVTTRKVGAISEKKFKLLRFLVLHFFTITLVVVVGSVAVLALVVGGILAADLGTIIANYFVMTILIVAALAFTLLTFLQLAFMHYVGYLLLRSIQQGEKKILASSIVALPKSQSDSQSEPPSKNIPYSKFETVNTKRVALKKAITILIGVTISIFLQCVGFFCIPFTILNSNSMLIFFGLHDSTLAAILILFIIIYRPLNEIQVTHSMSFESNQPQQLETISRSAGEEKSTQDENMLQLHDKITTTV
ncbi:hypothetical protein C9374_010845 [Naegleria lovaniensis]|uniref:Uncharacterized protein n=1 Tax=Naegleria lovaniensis TaxID=51637 RepID=A0AA88GF12_NAELO|nr:uncharacterized protein C9374_010845 [Naegleria lovaniensis]KAG2374275.1 hypothetical protein C9374_010845 [Naegleria lovaniensis]